MFHLAVLWGGTVPPDLDLATHGDALRAADLQLVMGEDDEFFGPEAVAAHEARLHAARVPFTSHRYEGGHRLEAEVLTRIARA